tara:strand:- start:2495 stop:2596 length:102 start_codon:yes stop_codon:yes gene_type:complete
MKDYSSIFEIIIAIAIPFIAIAFGVMMSLVIIT